MGTRGLVVILNDLVQTGVRGGVPVFSGHNLVDYLRWIAFLTNQFQMGVHMWVAVEPRQTSTSSFRAAILILTHFGTTDHFYTPICSKTNV